jgi:tripartite-type tricarboxylate transporter receptor subunit TctC
MPQHNEEKVMRIDWRTTLAALAVPALMGVAASSSAQANDYYKDKVLNVIVAGSPAGGHNRFARAVAPYLQKTLGASEVRVSNMPGGGGLKAASHIWRLPPDGYTVGFGNASSLLMAQIAGSRGVQFDVTKLTYMGRANSQPRVFAVGGKSPIKNIHDIVKLGRPFVYPSQGTDEDFYAMAVLADVMGFKVKAVTGYEGLADTELAVIKGDGDGNIVGFAEAMPSLRSGDKRPILILTAERVPEYPDVPTAIEVAPEAKKSVMRALADILETNRTYYAPPKSDPKAVEAFRNGLAAVMKNPALLEELKKNGWPPSFMHGDKQQQVIAEIAKEGESLSAIAKAAVKAIQ